MATALNLGNANGKTITLRNPDTNNSDITVEMDKVVVKDSSGNVVLASGSKIQGDFSNATSSNRTAFQTSTVNGNTIIGAKPSGTGNQAMFICESSSDSSNCVTMNIQATDIDTKVVSAIRGTASYTPMVFLTGGAERMRVDTAGNVGIGTSSPVTNLGRALHIYNTVNDGTPNSNASLKLESAYRNSAILLYGTTNTINMFTSAGVSAGGLAMNSTIGTSLFFGSNGFGYGTGSGGTVTQLTSKSTAVTISPARPSGIITMNNAALAAGASVIFQVNNSLVTNNDNVFLTNNYNEQYSMRVTDVNDGNFMVSVKNETAGSLADGLGFNFTIIKGSNS